MPLFYPLGGTVLLHRARGILPIPHCCYYPLTFLLAYPPPTSRVRDSEGKMELQLPRHLSVFSFVYHIVADRTFFFIFLFLAENTLHANLCALADHNLNACPLIQCLPVCLSSLCSLVLSHFTSPYFVFYSA